jgi:nicotinamidase-related amidase
LRTTRALIVNKDALIIIDAQQEYFAPIGKVVLPDGPQALGGIRRALEWARARGVPVIHVVHESRRPGAAIFVPGTPALEIRSEVAPAPGEAIITKHLPGSFTGTPLEQLLRERGIERVIVTGFMTQMCVDTTARQAAHLGFQVAVLADACAAKAVTGPDGVAISADQVHRTHLGSLQGFLADITTIDQLTR